MHAKPGAVGSIVSHPFDFALSKIPTSRAKNAREMGHPDFQRIRWAKGPCSLSRNSKCNLRHGNELQVEGGGLFMEPVQLSLTVFGFVVGDA
jgi:hypothetical protein